MLKDESIGGIDGGGGGGKNWAPICDTCRSAPGTVYCQADSAFQCTGCDANRVVSSHERVLVCEACERAPAAFICKADSAALCTKCDSNIHSANPLARRHQRVPILPIPGTLYRPPAIGHDGDAENEFLTQEVHETIYGDDADEAASLLLFNPVKNSNHGNNNGVLLGGEVVNQYLDLDVYNSDQQNQFGDQKNGDSSVVPVQSGDSKNQLQQHQYQSFQMGMDYEPSNSGYGYPASISHRVPVSSLDVNVVPDSSITDASIFHPRPPKGTINLLFSPRIHLPSQLTPMDREARVLRYKEKKKMRKFEKTIRYTSRKAYAETRPRIKGRFAKS